MDIFDCEYFQEDLEHSYFKVYTERKKKHNWFWQRITVWCLNIFSYKLIKWRGCGENMSVKQEIYCEHVSL